MPDFERRSDEWKLRAIAVPAALVLAVVFHAFPMGHQLQRIFLSMMVHEVGHAVTALWAGFGAAPMPWKTAITPDRMLLVTALIALLTVGLGARWYVAKKWHLVAVAGALLLAQYVMTFTWSKNQATIAFTFGGDGGAMVLGTALMLTFFAGRDTQIYQGALRWGFLVIGAAAFVDTFATWWAARTDQSVIPFGEIEGVGLSDPSKLVRIYQWEVDDLINRYVTLGCACLAVLTAVWIWAVWQARRAAP
jgi:hypothetical protein